MDIAAAAGVGRVTLYGHFKTRAELIDAALVRTIQRADQILQTTDTSGDPVQALTRLVASSWQIVDQFRNILLAAHRELPRNASVTCTTASCAASSRSSNAGSAPGRSARTCRSNGCITTAFSLMHAAAEDAAAGRVKVEGLPGSSRPRCSPPSPRPGQRSTRFPTDCPGHRTDRLASAIRIVQR